MAETYEQRKERLIRQLKGSKYSWEEWTRLVYTGGQNVANITEAEQKPYDTMTKALIQGASAIEASQQRGVNAAALQTFQNYQDNLTRLQTATVASDVNGLAEARTRADQTSGGMSPGTPTWRVEFLRHLSTRFGDGTNNNLLYGTMSQALREMDLNPNDPIVWNNLVALDYHDPGVNRRMRAIQTTYARVHDLNTVTNKLLLGLNDRLRDAPIGQDDEAVRAWWESQKQDWLPLATMNSEFKQTVMPAMSNKNDVFSLAIKANVAPGLDDASMTARAFQEALLANLPGEKDDEDTSEDERRMALFISNPNTRRLADQYGLGIGTVLDLDEAEAEAFQKRYPEGFYIPGVGLYISGVDDRKALQLAFNRLNDANPGNDGPFGIQPDEQPTYADVWLPAEYAPQATALGESPTLEGLVYWRAGDKIYAADAESGEVVEVAPDELPADLKPVTDPSASEAALRAKMPDLPMGQMTSMPEVIKKNVQIQENLYGDDIGRIRYWNPTTAKSELLPENARIEQVGGGGPRQTFRGAIERMMANASSNRGAKYAEQLDTPMQERRKSGMETLAETLVPRKVAAEPSRRHAPALPLSDMAQETDAEFAAEDKKRADEDRKRKESEQDPEAIRKYEESLGTPAPAPTRESILRDMDAEAAQEYDQGHKAGSPGPALEDYTPRRRDVIKKYAPGLTDEAPARQGAPAGRQEVPFPSRLPRMEPGTSPEVPAAPAKPEVKTPGAEVEPPPAYPEPEDKGPLGSNANRRNLMKKYAAPAYGKVAGGRNPASTQDPMKPPSPSSLRA